MKARKFVGALLLAACSLAGAQTRVPLSMMDPAVAPKSYVDSAIATEVTARNAAISAATGSVSAGAKAANRQVFTANGTWTKPSGFGANAVVFIEAWGGGGSGGRGTGVTGGGGGAYAQRWVSLSSLGATETVTVGAGGAARTTNGTPNVGANSSFGAWLMAYGGAGGGGGPLSAGTATMPGAPVSLSNIITSSGSVVGYSYVGGIGGSTSDSLAGWDAVGGVDHGGGGGLNAAGTGTGNGGASLRGGGGGGGLYVNQAAGVGGASVYGGAGGAASVSGNGAAGTAPGGGGGATASGASSGAGARGEVRITVFDGA